MLRARVVLGSPSFQRRHQHINTLCASDRRIKPSGRLFSTAETPLVAKAPKKRANLSTIADQATFLESIAPKLGISKLEDWYGVKIRDLSKASGSSLLKLYGNSLRRMITTIYSDHKWDVWKFTGISASWFDSVENERLFFERLLEDKGFKRTDLHELYFVTYQEVRDYGGYPILKKRTSVSAAVQQLFPEHNWVMSRFVRAPNKRWQSSAERKKLFEEMRVKIFGPDSPVENLAALSVADISAHKAASMLATYYRGNIRQALQDLYPEKTWDDALVRSVRMSQARSAQQTQSLKRGLTTREQRHQFFEFIRRQYGSTSLRWFYNVPQEVLDQTGASSFLKQYFGGSLHAALVEIYSDHIWEPHLFQQKKKAPGRPSKVKADAVALLSAQSAAGPDAPKRSISFGPIRTELSADAQALKALQDKLDIKSPTAVYSLSGKAVSAAIAALDPKHAKIIEKKFVITGAPVGTIQALAKAWYPAFKWKPWQFRLVPRSYWMNPANHRLFFDSFAVDNLIDSKEKWYQITHQQIIDYGGNGILSAFGNSLSNALGQVYPEHNWVPWKFHWTTSEVWKNPGAVFDFFESLRGKNDLDSLYNLAGSIRRRENGKKVLAAFKGSVLDALKTAYPEHSWDANKFTQKSNKKPRMVHSSTRQP